MGLLKKKLVLGTKTLFELSRRMQAMPFEKERREAQQADELQLREKAFMEKTRQREEDTRRQMELLQSLVQGIHTQGEAATRRAKNVRLPKLTEKDDIVSYLRPHAGLRGEKGEMGLQAGCSFIWHGTKSLC